MPSRLLRLIQQLIRRGMRHEERAVADQLRVLKETRKDVLRELAVLPVESYRAAQLGTVLEAIDRAMEPHQAESLRIGAEAARTAYAIGREQAESTMGDLPPMLGGTLTRDLLQAVVDVTEDQLRDVWGELGSGLKASVRRVALGAADLDTAIGEVLRIVRNPKTFGTAATRAEVIVRTEVNRTYSVAADARFRELNATFDGELRKAWIATGDRRTRASHREAGRRYAPNANDPGPIPIRDVFIVGGDRLRFPLDPLAPARAVVNCRCRMIAIPPSVSASEWAAFTEEWINGEETGHAYAG